jgi:hypothetical protein
LEYLPPAIRRNWPVYAGAGAVAVACLLVLIVWLAVRKPGDTGIIGGQGVIQNPEAVPPVDYLRLISPAEASRHVNQRCIIEIPVKSVRTTKDGNVILDCEANPSDPGNVPVLLASGIVQEYKQASITDLNAYFMGKTIRATGKVFLGGSRAYVTAEDKNNIWFTPPTQVVNPLEAGRYVNIKCDVQFWVQSTGHTKEDTLLFLNSDSDYRHPQNFTVIIPASVAEQFKARGIVEPMTHFYHQTIRVKGQVILNQGRAQIQVEGPDQIRLVK